MTHSNIRIRSNIGRYPSSGEVRLYLGQKVIVSPSFAALRGETSPCVTRDILAVKVSGDTTARGRGDSATHMGPPLGPPALSPRNAIRMAPRSAVGGRRWCPRWCAVLIVVGSCRGVVARSLAVAS